MKTLYIIFLFSILQYAASSQCINTFQNPFQEVETPVFGGYQLEVSNTTEAGDYFATKILTQDKLITVDIANGDPVYVSIYIATSSGLVIVADGVTPLTASLSEFFGYQIHVNTIIPLCGSDNIDRTITLECEDCPPHKGVGINVTEIDKSAALHIGSGEGGLLLPSSSDVNSISLASEGLLYYNNIDDELSFYDGENWRQTLSHATTSSHFDFRRYNSNSDGTDGTFISVYNTDGQNGRTTGLRLFTGLSDWNSASAIFYRTNVMHFAQKNNDFLDVISIEDSFLEMDRNSMKFTGTSLNTGLQFKANSLNSDNALYVNNETDSPIYIHGDLSFEEKVTIGGSIDINTSLNIVGAENDGITSTLQIKSGSQRMIMDGNEIDAYFPGLYLQNNSDSKLILANGGGLVGIAETSPTAMLHIKQVGAGQEALRIENDTDSDNWAFEVIGDDLGVYFNGTYKARIDATDGSWDQTSDSGAKKDVVYDRRSILKNILALKPASYSYIDNVKGDRKSYGFIAQEVQELFPELVTEDEGEYLTISYSELSVLAIKAIQEQQEVIRTLEVKYEKLIERLEKLEK